MCKTKIELMQERIIELVEGLNAFDVELFKKLDEVQMGMVGLDENDITKRVIENINNDDELGLILDEMIFSLEGYIKIRFNDLIHTHKYDNFENKGSGFIHMLNDIFNTYESFNNKDLEIINLNLSNDIKLEPETTIKLIKMLLFKYKDMIKRLDEYFK